MDKLILTGNAGFIGQRFYDMFGHQYKIDCYERGDTPPTESTLTGAKAVVHLGGITNTLERDIDKIMTWNTDYTENLFYHCQRARVQMIFASSASIYGNGDRFYETANPDPRSPYAWSKYISERLLVLKSEMAPSQCLRFFNVFGGGEGHKGEQASVFHKFPIQAQHRKKINVFEGSDQIYRDFIHVDDVCRIIERFIGCPETGIYNVGTGQPYSFYEIARIVADHYNVPIEEIPVPEEMKGQYQYYTCSDNLMLSTVIGKYDFISPVQWMRDNVD